MSGQLIGELNKFGHELGYPFDSILSPTKSNNYSSDWVKISNSFKLFDEQANDDQLLMCGNVKYIYKFMPSFMAALSSKNGAQAINRLANYEQLIGSIVMGTFEEEKNIRIHISYLDDYRKHSRFSLLVDQISIISLLREGTKLSIKPISIGSPYEYGDKITAFLGIESQKSFDNYLVFRKKDLLKPFVTQNDVVWNFMKPGLKQYVEKSKINPSFTAVVQNKLFKLIVGGNFQLKDLANSIDVSPRTIQRWLKSEGTNFKEQVNLVQKILALNLLQDLTLSTADVSFLVGLKSVSTFYKLFKKWTGKTVSTYRRQFILAKNIKKTIAE